MRLDDESEHLYPDKFWNSLDTIIAGVDNEGARKYLDKQALFYEKPFFEAGTKGTEGHAQIFIPFQTKTFADYGKPTERQIPLCTIQYPYKIEHAIYWAQLKLKSESFVSSSSECKNCLQNPEEYLKNLQSKAIKRDAISLARNIKTFLALFKISNEEVCIMVAKTMFDQFFNEDVNKLIQIYPEEFLNETGVLFWKAPKRFPKLMNFDILDELHIEFIKSVANIYCDIFDLPRIQSIEFILNTLAKSKLSIPRFIDEVNVF